MDNIMVESLRNSVENSFENGEEINPADVLAGQKAVLAKSFEVTVRDTVIAGGGQLSTEPNNHH
jgi:hypothetical protein